MAPRFGGALLLALWCSVGVAAAPATTAPATGPQSLQRFLTESRTFTGNFHQVVLDEARKPIQESKGKLWIERPNKFRWNYDAPYKQQIVADGERLWVYDEDLSQVTVRPLDRALLDSPAMLLAGRGRVDEQFNVKDLGSQQDLEWVQLLPKRKDGAIEEIRIGFEQGKLRRFDLRDGFGQTTRYTISNAQENITIDPARFSFTPPKGVDVVGDP